MKVAIYTRVSTDHEDQLSSLKHQEEYYIEYCHKKGYEIYKIYADEGLSGTSAKREKFLEMLHDAGVDAIIKKNGRIEFELSDRKPKFEMIITKDVSRFARNINAIEIVRALKRKGVYIFFENADLSTKMNDWEFRLGLFLLFSQQESIDRSKKVRFGKLQRAKKGHYKMSVVLFGYEYDKQNDKYVVNEEEAAIVREIFDMYTNQNKGTKIIAKELNQRGIKTRRGKKWDGEAVKRLLTNEKYIGKVIVHRYTKPDVMSSARYIERDPSEWVILENAIPAIIDEETWKKAQEIMESRVQFSKTGRKVGAKTGESDFYKKLICAKCGAYFTRVSTTKMRKKLNAVIKEYNYFCRNRRIYGTCDMKGISHNTLEREIMNFVQSKILHEMIKKKDYEKQMYEMLMNIQKRKMESVEKEREKIQNEINEIGAQIDKLYDTFLTNENSQLLLEATQRKIEQLERKRKKLEREKMKYDMSYIEEENQQIQRSYQKIQEYAEKERYTFEEILAMIQKIVVYEETEEGRELEFYFNLPTMLAYIFEDEIEDVETEIIPHSWKIQIK
ncbi:recombinase family protein [Geobacillus sp. B4113_201601]|uniref:recombinase family protein n=1 Tax=Geobacillus sp. B4113_201601 TaxID=1586290 RepID=UPI000784EAA8|nr:recombinase family protein [Geobacillus sp. B4113_201601]KYD30036.1 hypothetical protein B4113_1069 [Geobacillus sp. B4113_201601]